MLNNDTNPSNIEDVYTVENKPFEPYLPTRDGYKFMGWYYDEDFAGSKITKITPLSLYRDITLYAK